MVYKVLLCNELIVLWWYHDSSTSKLLKGGFLKEWFHYICTSCQLNMSSHQNSEDWRLWQYGLWSFQTGGTKLERFLPKNQHTQRKLLNFENWINGEVSKISSHFRNKSRSILKLSKNVNNKKCAPKLIFFNGEKKLRKIRMIFDIENWLKEWMNKKKKKISDFKAVQKTKCQ